MLERRIPELTRKARTHRLYTRGGMPESFLICPGELINDQMNYNRLMHGANRNLPE